MATNDLTPTTDQGLASSGWGSVNTEGLGGYAAEYVKSMQSYGSDLLAHASATQATGTGGSGDLKQNSFSAFSDEGGSRNYEVLNDGGIYDVTDKDSAGYKYAPVAFTPGSQRGFDSIIQQGLTSGGVQQTQIDMIRNYMRENEVFQLPYTAGELSELYTKASAYAQEAAAMEIEGAMNGAYGLQQQAIKAGKEAMTALQQGYAQMSSTIDATGNAILGTIRQQMGADDPQMAAAIGLIKQEAQKLNNQLLEEMNTRGVVGSGMYAQSLQTLNADTNTNITKFITQRVGDLQTQLNNSMLTMAQLRIGSMTAHEGNLTSLMNAANTNITNAGIADQNYALGQEQIASNESIASMNRSNDLAIAGINAKTQMYGYDKGLEGTKYSADMSFKASAADNQTSLTVARMNNDTSLAIQESQSKTALNVANIQAAASRYAASRSGSGGMSPAQVQAMKNQAITQGRQDIDMMIAAAKQNGTTLSGANLNWMMTDTIDPVTGEYMKEDALSSYGKLAGIGTVIPELSNYVQQKVSAGIIPGGVNAAGTGTGLTPSSNDADINALMGWS